MTRNLMRCLLPAPLRKNSACTTTSFYTTAWDVVGVSAWLPHVYDAPFADPSALPTVLLCERLVETVTVALLCGDGGDETLCGYPWHRALEGVERWRTVSVWLRRSALLALVHRTNGLDIRASSLPRGIDRISGRSCVQGFSSTMSRHLPIAGRIHFPISVITCASGRPNFVM